MALHILHLQSLDREPDQRSGKSRPWLGGDNYLCKESIFIHSGTFNAEDCHYDLSRYIIFIALFS